MKKVLLTSVIVSVFIVVIILIAGIRYYNSFVDMENNIEEAEAQVINRLNLRQESIALLLPTLQGLQEHAETLYKMITDARTSYNNAVNAGDIAGIIQADAAQVDAINQLRITFESNPDFFVEDAFIYFMDSVVGIENALSQARRDYNASILQYNSSIRKFPRNIVYKMFSFEGKKPYWGLNDGASEIPKITFDKNN